MSDTINPASSGFPEPERSAAAASPTDGEILVSQTELKPGALRLPAVVMQSVTLIAPAFSLVLVTQVVASFTGITVPLAFAVISLIFLLMAVALSELARSMPSAGAFYTYASRALHPRVGFMAGWLYLIAIPLATGWVLAIFGETLDGVLQDQFSVHIPWWVSFLVLSTIVAFIIYRGIELSAKNLVILGGIEILIMVVLAIWGLADPGPGGLNLSPFNPGDATSAHGLYLAVVFSLFAMIGWEEAAPLAEETENPHRNIPLAMIGSVALMGLLFVFCTWGIIVGFGTSHLNALINGSEAPALVIAHNYWGDVGTIIVLLALLNSSVAASIAGSSAATRLVYGMGRSNALPRWFGKVHPSLKTPVNSVRAQIALTFVTALAFGFAMGPEDYFNTFALADTLGVGLFFAIVMVGVPVFFLRQHRSEFNPIKHLVLPLFSAAAMLWVLYKSINPLPPSPVKWAVFGVVGWIVLGIGILFIRKATGQDDWLREAGLAPAERPETPAELAARPAPWE
jgi:amino acid transporter